MTQPPPALSAQPQFTDAYWAKAPREKTKTKLVRITHLDDEFDQFVFDNGNAFDRRVADLNSDVKLHANQDVYVETINGELVTGMWVPEQGWAFRMSAQDLADYAKKMITAMHNKRQNAKHELTDFVQQVISTVVYDQVGEGGREFMDSIDFAKVATELVSAMEQYNPSSSAHA